MLDVLALTAALVHVVGMLIVCFIFNGWLKAGLVCMLILWEEVSNSSFKSK